MAEARGARAGRVRVPRGSRLQPPAVPVHLEKLLLHGHRLGIGSCPSPELLEGKAETVREQELDTGIGEMVREEELAAGKAEMVREEELDVEKQRW